MVYDFYQECVDGAGYNHNEAEVNTHWYLMTAGIPKLGDSSRHIGSGHLLDTTGQFPIDVHIQHLLHILLW